MNNVAGDLATTWHDSSYNWTLLAFYCARVLENPICGGWTWDALHTGGKPRNGFAETLQERAWTSPVWVNPQGTEAGTTKKKWHKNNKNHF